MLEERWAPAVDLSRFSSFLPSAVDSLQHTGVNEELYNVSLPIISGGLAALASQGDGAANFLLPVAQSLQTAFASLNAAPAEATFIDTLNFALGNLLVTGVQRVAGDPAGNSVEYSFQVGVNEANALTATDVPLGTDLGFPGLGVRLDGTTTTTVHVWYDATVRFGVNVTTDANNQEVYGVFLNTNATNPELHLHVKADLSSATLAGSIGLLQFSASAQPGTGLQVDYNADLVDPDGHLDQDEINAGGVDFASTASLNTNILLDLTAGFGGNVYNPTVNSDFSLTWSATGDPEVTSIADFDPAVAPAATFANVRMDVTDGLFKGFLAPILGNVREITGPIEPIVAALNTKPLEALGINDTWLGILSTYLGFSEDQTRYLTVVTSLVTLAQKADEAAASGSTATLQLGSFDLTDVRLAGAGFAGTPTTFDALTELATTSTSFYNALKDVNGGAASVPGNGVGFDLHFLEDPVQLFKLFLGQSDATLFTFTMPTLHVGVAKTVPIIGPAALPPFPFPIVSWTLGVEGSLGMQGDLTVGFDAQGLVDFQADPGHDPSLVGNGFFVDTTKPLLIMAGWDPDANGGGGAIDFNAPVFNFFGSIDLNLSVQDFAEKAGVEVPDWLGDALDAIIPISFSASGKLSAGLIGNLSVGLNGGGNNHLRYADLNGDCLFNVSGGIGFGGKLSVSASVSASIPFLSEITDWLGGLFGTDLSVEDVSYDWNFDLYTFPTIPLFTFDSQCPGGNAGGGATPAETNPQLATLLGDGTLRLNVGSFVGGPPADGNRQIEPNEINERYAVRHVSGDPNDPAGETVKVQAFGVSEEFSGVKAIRAEAGDGNDQIRIDSAVLAPSFLYGQGGDDTLQAGGGPAYLDGGDGNDILTGGNANDVIIGGAGDDTIDGRGGDDLIAGGAGNDSINGGGGFDTLTESLDTDWSLIRNKLTGSGTDTLSRIELVNLHGGASANSFTVRQWGGSVHLFGEGSNDLYTIEMLGAGSGGYTVSDSAGDNDQLVIQGSGYTIPGSRNRDDFELTVGRVTDRSEGVDYTGIDSLTVDGGRGQDRFNVRATSAATPVLVLGGDDSDSIHVSTNAGTNDDGSTSSIQGPLRVDAGTGGGNRLVISNYGGNAAAPVILEAAASGFQAIRGLAPVDIFYKAAGFNLGGFLPLSSGSAIAGYDPAYGVIVRGSNSDADQIFARSTPDYASMKVEGNGGDDTFTVGNLDNNISDIKGRLLLDGGDPACGDPGDSLQVNFAGTRTIVRTTDPGGGAIHASIVQDSDGASVGFVHFETVADVGILVSGADAGAGPDVHVYDSLTRALRFQFFAYDPRFTGGVRVAAGDVNGDGIPDIVTAAGAGGGPNIQVFDGITGQLLRSFFAFAAGFTGGVDVAVADLDCDGFQDIIAGAGPGGGPNITVFSGADGTMTASFFAFAQGFTGGVHVAAGDLDGRGVANIVAGAGAGGGPNVTVFGGQSFQMLDSFFAYDPDVVAGGVYVAVGDVTGDRKADVVTGPGNASPSNVRVWDGPTLNRITSLMVRDPFSPFASDQIPLESGVRVGVADFNSDGILDIVTAKGPGTRNRVRVYTDQPLAEIDNFYAYDPLLGTGLFVAGSK